MLDYPFDEMAKRYLSAQTDGERAMALDRFMNTKGPGRDAYLLMLLKSAGVREELTEYVANRDAPSLTFQVPVIGVSLSRVNFMMSLAAAFAVTYCYMLGNRSYALRLRSETERPSERWRDPSFLTATPSDLCLLSVPQCFTVILGRSVVLLVLPLVLAFLMGWMCLISGSGRLWGATAAFVLACIASCAVWIDWKDYAAFYTAWKSGLIRGHEVECIAVVGKTVEVCGAQSGVADSVSDMPSQFTEVKPGLGAVPAGQAGTVSAGKPTAR